MRLLFLFLVLINELIYLWYADRQTVDTALAIAESKAPQLILLSESGREFQPEKTEPPVNETAVANDSPQYYQRRACFTLGPFMSEESMQQASEKLILSGHPFEKRTSEKKEQIGYWVYLPSFATLDAARQKAREFKLLGEKHYYVVKPPSDYAYGISLGVFKDRKNAEQRQRQIKNLGYDAILEGRFRQNPVYWLDYIELDGGKSFDNSELPGSQIHPRICETA